MVKLLLTCRCCMIEAMFLTFLLFSKHFFIDHPLQTDYQRENKHLYAHFGGISHALVHGLLTFVILTFFTPQMITAVCLGVINAVVHYHIDWGFAKLMQRVGWSPQCDKEYWWFMGLSQYLHAVTYISIVIFALKV